MDPKKAFRDMVLALIDRDVETAKEYAQALAGWIDGGGFTPEISREDICYFCRLVARMDLR